MEELIIRRATPADAQAVLDHSNAVASESDNLTYGVGQLDVTYDQELAFIEKLSVADNAVMLLGFIGRELVSVLTLTGMHRPRVHHFSEVGITVRRAYWGRGIGKHMMEKAEAFAYESGVIRRLHLRVRTDNERAVSLYEGLGYEMEGTIHRQFRFIDPDGRERFADVYAMGKNID
ncbi:GNAT family N-acetyltransferase [Fusibacter sp. JL216-2]|uniref:GNAT family N-acetyltransferase n=1 Tax=Fusibacter sp. JL216-2 TaxID=3071453 RepID=UPI003D3524B8